MNYAIITIENEKDINHEGGYSIYKIGEPLGYDLKKGEKVGIYAKFYTYDEAKEYFDKHFDF